jgi:hypothetical protein
MFLRCLSCGARIIAMALTFIQPQYQHIHLDLDCFQRSYVELADCCSLMVLMLRSGEAPVLKFPPDVKWLWLELRLFSPGLCSVLCVKCRVETRETLFEIRYQIVRIFQAYV